MIPEDIIKLLSKQRGDLQRSEDQKESVNENIKALGASLCEEFISFFRSYDLIKMTSNQNVELLDLCSPNNEILETTEWAKDVFELNNGFICLTSGEDESFILFSTFDQCVYDVSISELDDLEAGVLKPKWGCFYDLIRWYLATLNPNTVNK